MNLFVILSALFCIPYCSAHGIRSPPPLHAEFEDWTECIGNLEGWQWDRCSINDAVVWTSMAFGHMRVAGILPPRAMGGHIQYAPFTAEHPFLVSIQSPENGMKFFFPPMAFSVYIQSEVLLSSLWNPKMSLFLSSHGYKMSWIEQFTHAAFDCDCNDTVTLSDGVLIFKSNTEYLVDNLMFHGVEDALFPWPLSSDVEWLNAHTTIEPHITGSKDASIFYGALSWNNSFAIANDRPKTQTSVMETNSPKRAFATLGASQKSR